MSQDFSIEYTCPYCHRGKTMADHSAKANVSCKCSECKQVYICNLGTGRAEKAKARASPNSPRKPTPKGPNTTEYK